MGIFQALIRCMELVSITQSCPTLCGSMDYSPPGSSIHGILQARILEWVAIPFCRGSSWPRDRTQVSCIGVRFFTIWATREALWSYFAFTINSSSVLGEGFGQLFGVYSALPSPIAGLLAIALDLTPSVSSTFWNFGYHNRPRCAAVRTVWKVQVPRSWARSRLTGRMLLAPLCAPNSSHFAIPSGLLAALFRYSLLFR